MGRKRKAGHAPDPATENVRAAVATLDAHPLFAPLRQHASFIREPHNLCPPTGWAVVTTNGYVHVHPTRRAEPAEWV